MESDDAGKEIELYLSVLTDDASQTSDGLLSRSAQNIKQRKEMGLMTSQQMFSPIYFSSATCFDS
jgi:hypothetical protein